MDILVLLIPLSVGLVLAIGAAFWWAVAAGQFDDLEGPAHRILADDDSSDAIPGAPASGGDVAERREGLTTINAEADGRR